MHFPDRHGYQCDSTKNVNDPAILCLLRKWVSLALSLIDLCKFVGCAFGDAIIFDIPDQAHRLVKTSEQFPRRILTRDDDNDECRTGRTDIRNWIHTRFSRSVLKSRGELQSTCHARCPYVWYLTI